MGLLGLLEPADPEPVVAGVVAHADAGTVEGQVVRTVAALWVSTRRPIVAVVDNVVQLTRGAVETYGGQVKVFACVSSRRKGLRYRPAVTVSICAPICAVDSGVAVVTTYVCLLLKPYTTFI